MSSFELHTLRPSTAELFKAAVREGVDPGDASLRWKPTHRVPQFQKNGLTCHTSAGPRRVTMYIDHTQHKQDKAKDTRGFVDEDGDGVDDRMQSLSAMQGQHEAAAQGRKRPQSLQTQF